MDQRLEIALKRWDLANPRPLAGDAGLRQYFRVDHRQLSTAVLAFYPPQDPDKIDDPYFEYRALQAYLDPVVRVPTIIRYDDDDRAMLLEDLGDTTLEKHLTLHAMEESEWAGRAIDNLITWLGILTEGAPPRAFFMLRKFDRAKFDFEWNFCRNHFFNEFLQKDPPRWLDRLMEDVHEFLESRAHYLCHRDFHVRNLMVRGQHLVTIDFQDARKGVATYDLASILFDGYWDWSEEASLLFVNRIQHELNWPDAEFWGELNVVALQRNLKALGTFGYQIVHRKKACFAPAIPRTLRHILGHFQRLRHGEGVIQAEHWERLARQRLLKSEE